MKLFYIIFFIIFLSGCSSIPDSSWKSPLQVRKNALFLEPGDILIKKKKSGFLEWFGHCGILIDNFTIAEFPKIGTGMHLLPLSNWAFGDRKIIVLRFKNCNDEFKFALIQNIFSASNKNYKIVFNKKNESGFYCSQFIWDMYYSTGLKFGQNIDIDIDKGVFVFPYDFYGSNFLEEVTF